MKKKYILAAFAVGLCMTANVMAQVPSYVPTNGLLGWYPFNGNANDESALGTNGTVNTAVLSTDRFGLANKAYYFNGVNSNIDLGINSSINSISNAFSISYWIKPEINGGMLIANYSSQGVPVSSVWRIATGLNTSGNVYYQYLQATTWQALTTNSLILNLNSWYHCVYTRSGSTANIYINGVLVSSNNNFANGNLSNPTSPAATTKFGYNFPSSGGSDYYKGQIDDVGFWNRVLTPQEITILYNVCVGNTITSQPMNSVSAIGSNAQFTINAASGSTYQWQNNPLNNGWQNVNNNSTYSGATTNTLTVSNTTVSNYNQPFRAIVNAGGCIDTSSVAQIIIGDTCLTTVTDTLIINTTLGLPAPNNENTILIYPNPASDHITIDNGNYSAMAGYTIKIENNAGQQVFQSLINQAQFYVDLSTWSGNGLYFVHLIDAQGNTVTVRNIVLQ
jgi:hypothetical protein